MAKSTQVSPRDYRPLDSNNPSYDYKQGLLFPITTSKNQIKDDLLDSSRHHENSVKKYSSLIR